MKPVREWTLWEAQKLCKDNNNCTRCPFLGEIFGGVSCRLAHPASMWDLSVAVTEPTQVAYGTNAPIKPDKPRLAKVLGLKDREKIKIVGNGFHTDWIEIPEDDDDLGAGVCIALIHAIYHPESVIRTPRLTEAELERCRVCGAKYVCMDKHPNGYVALHSAKPVLHEGGCYCENNYIGTLDSDLFPSVHPGDCICVEEASGK